MFSAVYLFSFSTADALDSEILMEKWIQFNIADNNDISYLDYVAICFYAYFSYNIVNGTVSNIL
jgi:hypothetical protein